MGGQDGGQNEHVHGQHSEKNAYVHEHVFNDNDYSSDSDYLFEHNTPTKVNNSTITNTPVSVKSLRQNNRYESFGVMPIYDVCPALKKKPLLSDNCCHILDDGVGTTFSGGAVEFRTEVIKYSVHLGFRFNYTKNNKSYIYGVCCELDNCGCGWFIKAKLQPITFFLL